jgi:hypothetical protein
MAKKLTTTDLISYIDKEVNLASTYNTKIQQERTDALKYYRKEPFGNEKKGRSTYISSEVQETISWAIPQVMKIFSTNDIVKFDPMRPEAKEAAEMATYYANHVLNKQNPGFLILHNFFHDALLQKNGFLKVYYDNSENFEREEYTDLTDIEMTQLLQDPAVEPITHDTIQLLDPLTGQMISNKHDLTIKRRINSTGGRIKIENVPVEEVVVSKLARSIDLDESPFVAHRVKRSISWLREQGYKIPDDINDGVEQTTDYSLEKMTRDLQDGSFYGSHIEEDPADPSMRLVWVTEAYFKVDFNNDGIAETRKITKVGSTILDNEEVYGQPFISTSPFPQPHKFNGLSMADLVKDLQLLKSMLMRAMLDSFAFNINPSKAVDVTKIVDVNDLLDTNPGNFIRLRGDVNQSIYSIPSSGVGAEAFNLLNYVDDIAESRSGVSKLTQGIDKNVFNKTATGTQAIMNASQEKLALIVRIFAETGLGPLYKKIVELASKFSDAPELIEVNSQYVEVRPMEWKHLKSITVNVGTGTLDKGIELQNLTNLIQLQEKLGATQKPELMSIIDPMKVYNIISDATKSMGIQNPNQYFNKPGSQEYMGTLQYIQQANMPPPPAPDPQLAFVEVEKQKMQQQMIVDTANFELDKLKADREFELKKYEMQLKYELEMAKLTQKDNIELMASQLEQVSNLNPSNELLPESEIGAITAVLNNAGTNQGQGSLYAQLLQQKEIEKAMMEQERLRQKAETDGIMNMIHDLSKQVNAPKKFTRDAEGRINGVEPDLGAE